MSAPCHVPVMQWRTIAVVAIALVGCDEPRPIPVRTGDEDAERARMLQCCQGLTHDAWNSDPPNPQVLHAARACELLAKEGKLEEAREQLEIVGRATMCDKCPLNGCRR